MTLVETETADVTEIGSSADDAWNLARSTFDEGRTRPVAWRLDQLDGLIALLTENEPAVLDALATDLGKPSLEGFTTDIGATLAEVKHLRRHVPKWAKGRSARVPLHLQPARAKTKPEPLGTTLIIAPWNYPVQLLIEPLAASLAAGNTAVCKPSEFAPATAALLADLLPRYVDPEAVVVATGGPEVSVALLELRWDHIFFTGSTRIGRLVMQAAAKHLTPVTLELGGKSPCYVDGSADINLAANRIAWGKFLNAGQTCVAPDYILVARERRDELIAALGKTIESFYGSSPITNEDYGRIVSDSHLDRLQAMIESTGGETVVGGQVDPGQRYVAPTLIRDPALDSPIMQEEIFGPLLPIIAVDSVDEAVQFVNAREKPLALYAFASDRKVIETIEERTSSGGLCVNHTVVHITPSSLPFGGVGESGMGRYHGRAGFDAFSNLKSVVRVAAKPDLPIIYPPYTNLKDKIIRRFLG